MASSTFAVSSTSDNEIEKEIDLELDTCDENGIMSTTLEGELPKDHTYTKEPDVSEGDLNESMDTSNQLDEMLHNVTSENSRPSRTSRSSKAVKKAPVKPKPKKTMPEKKKTVSKRNKAKEEEETVKEEPVLAVEDVTADSEVEETNKVEVKESKPARRGSKRKLEEKENVLEQNAEESAPEKSEKEPPPKRQTARTKSKKPSRAQVLPKNKVANDDTFDTENLPKGWKRQIVIRKSGKTAGMCDIYYYSPDGSKFRSKPDIAAYLMRTKSNLKLDIFNFHKKLIDSPAASQKKLAVPKPKTSSPKKPTTPKKNAKLLVKIVSAKSKKKGRKGSKGSKKK